MSFPRRDSEYLLPAGSRLFHIGLPKTGTTALQASVAALRPTLLEHGVVYPGRAGLTHRKPVFAMMQRGWGWGSPPSMSNWQRLQQQIDADPDAYAWISHEYACESTPEIIRRFRDALGETLHAVVTMRNFADSLPSAWNQFVKAGARVRFDNWIRAVLSDPPNTKITPNFFGRNPAEVVERWSDVLGPENLTVIVVDKAQPDLISTSFEDLLGLPRDMLRPRRTGFESNRGLGVREAELVRQLNGRLKEQGVTWDDYDRWVRRGVVHGLLSNRRPLRRFAIPAAFLDRANQLNVEYTDRILARGVRVIGDPDLLRAPVAGEADQDYAPQLIPIDIAVEAIMGLIAATNEEESTDAGGSARVASTPARELLAEVARRGRRKAARRARSTLRDLRTGRS